ncbi:MAG: adenylate/guanylate cyclase domain-containing protein [Leptospiraceae bacterium]|nr:adenylate/guanylate cyclase domain-containing protein [Leptospiraceae bacterium]MDW8306592.1 adenylate/guanylate cyclase domain-containing protein [Leptospiraceae bacterium]
MDLDHFLKLYPWPQEYAREPKVEWLWDFFLPISPETLWPHIIDTSSFNRLLGLNEMHYREEAGKLWGKSKTALFLLSWQEVSWEWEYLKGLNNARIYDRGFASYVRARYILEKEKDGTKLIVYFGWIPRHFLGKILLVLAQRIMRQKYAITLHKLVEVIRQGYDFTDKQRLLYRASLPEIKVNLSLLQNLLQQTEKLGAKRDILQFFESYIQEASEDELYRIRLRPLAQKLGRDLYELLHAALLATKSGLFTLSYDVTCPHCKGVRQEIASLGDIPENARCDVCGIDFESTKPDTLEVVFHLNPAVRAVAKRFYCAAEPAQKRHIVIQRHLKGYETLKIKSLLPRGEYLLYFRGTKNRKRFFISDEGSADLFFDGEISHSQVRAKDLEITVVNPWQQETTFIVERIPDTEDALHVGDLLSYQLFRDIFPSAAIASGLKLEVGQQAILFSDIVGSTKFYDKRGDAEAFLRVRQHFIKIYEVVRSFHGAIVKTIGDAVMATFCLPEYAYDAAVHIQEIFSQNIVPDIRLRVGIHYGDCLAVNLNTGLDYFGKTVNTAAKLQSLAAANEIVFSHEFLEALKEKRNVPCEIFNSVLFPGRPLYKLKVNSALRPV